MVLEKIFNSWLLLDKPFQHLEKAGPSYIYMLKAKCKLERQSTYF